MKQLFAALQDLDTIFKKHSPASFNYKVEQIREEFGFKTRNDVVEYYIAWDKEWN
jgi:hypothetical protein